MSPSEDTSCDQNHCHDSEHNENPDAYGAHRPRIGRRTLNAATTELALPGQRDLNVRATKYRLGPKRFEKFGWHTRYSNPIQS
jgi:hypothetical protein